MCNRKILPFSCNWQFYEWIWIFSKSIIYFNIRIQKVIKDIRLIILYARRACCLQKTRQWRSNKKDKRPNKVPPSEDIYEDRISKGFVTVIHSWIGKSEYFENSKFCKWHRPSGCEKNYQRHQAYNFVRQTSVYKIPFLMWTISILEFTYFKSPTFGWIYVLGAFEC